MACCPASWGFDGRLSHAARRVARYWYGTVHIYIRYLCTMIQCGRQSSRLGRASVNSTCPEAASAMPFCREYPCLLPNIRARSRGCPSRFRCTSADGGMRACFSRRRAVRAARNGVSCKRAPIPRFGQRHRYIRETTSRVVYALSALAVVLIAQTSAKKLAKPMLKCASGWGEPLRNSAQPLAGKIGLAKKLCAAAF